MDCRNYFWLTAHRDLADDVLAGPTFHRLCSIHDRLARFGYALKLDVGKRSTRAIVIGPAIRTKSTYTALDRFIADEGSGSV